jgi:2-polyprenyl-6-methoxyphenol hydroxylase-like FAD-dependent oxidoreductase
MMKKTIEMRPKIVIIGAGLGGLALAQGLAKAGFHATVFERDESPVSRPQGYRISIRSLGMRALSALLTPEKMAGLSKAKIADVGEGFTCANENMEPFFNIAQGQDLAIQLLRTELRSLLQEGIDIKWNKRLVMFEDNQSQVVAHFEDGSHATGDLLVGCDGGGSIIRELMPLVYGNSLGSIPKVINGTYVSLSGQINRLPEWDSLLPLNKTGMVRYVGANYSLGVCFSERANRSPTVYWGLSEKVEDRSASWYSFDESLESRKRLLEHCKQVMQEESWHESLRKLVCDTPAQAMMAPWFMRTTQFSDANQYPLVPSGRVTLLGDSAHAMSPDRGLGGNNVLEDARVLSTLLASSSKPINWKKWIEQYEREMFARARIAVQESESASAYFHNLRSLS